MLKQAAKAEGEAEKELEEIRRVRAAKIQAKKEWEEGRESRVQNWRDFAKKSKEKRKLPPRKTPDATYQGYTKNKKTKP